MSTVGRTTDNVEPRHQIVVRAALAYLAVYWAQAVADRTLAHKSVKCRTVNAGTGWEYVGNLAQAIVTDLSDDLCNLGLSTPARLDSKGEHQEELKAAILAGDAARFQMTPTQRHEFTRCLADFTTRLHTLGVRAEVAR